MPLMKVVWEIDVEADTALEAITQAISIIQDPDNTASVFAVSKWEKDEKGNDTVGIPQLIDYGDYGICYCCCKTCNVVGEPGYSEGKMCQNCGTYICNECLKEYDCPACGAVLADICSLEDLEEHNG